MHRGYTKRWRKRWDKGSHKDHLLWVMMDYFIDFANYKDSEVYFPGAGMVKLKRGQHIFGTLQLANFFGVNRSRIRRKLELMKNIEFSTIKTTNKYSILTVLNYDTYNPIEYHQRPSNRPETDQQPTTPNKDNKDNKRSRDISTSKKQKSKTFITRDFQITEDMQKWFQEQNANGIDIYSETNRFIDHWLSKGEARADWIASWRNWIRNAIKWGKGKEGDFVC